ncbi:twin-arginine translocation signal domain-containing protein, partial [Burkholderia cenocepacia]|nr:twin-arginine translocation signal domain-containing protein [Burkholderia cenocepacia]
MGLNRRQFLKLTGGAAAGVTVAGAPSAQAAQVD